MDVCIVGSGPAGLCVAHELIGSGLRVCIVESGERRADPEAQALSEGEVLAGLPGTDLGSTRQRQVGGNSNLWCIKIGRERRHWRFGVRYLPFAPEDFAARAWVPHSGWPISHADIVPFLRRAQTLAEIADEARTLCWLSPDPDPFGLERGFEGRVFRFGPGAAYHARMRAAIEATPGFEILPGHTVVRLERMPGASRASCAHLRTLDGRASVVSARAFVLAAGGVENARLLLLSRAGTGPALGNAHDMVGRGFMDHPLLHVADIIPKRGGLWSGAAPYDFRTLAGELLQGYAALTPQRMTQQELLAAAISVFPRPSARRTRAIDATRNLVEALRGAEPVTTRTPRHLRDLALGLDALPRAAWRRLRGEAPLPGFGRGGWSQHANPARHYRRFELMLQVEQAPDFENRVMLAGARDRFGLPRACVRARLGELEHRTIVGVRELIRDCVERAGQARCEPVFGPGAEPYTQPVSMAHHVGTTRMGASPRTSVVDRDCRLHEAHNVFVTGSSVFPTSSYANPTLTIVAFAARLGAHLARELTRAPRLDPDANGADAQQGAPVVH